MAQAKVQHAIVGGGALGLLLAGKLKASGSDCVLWTRTSRQAALLRQEGLTLLDREGAAIANLEIEAYAMEEARSIDEGLVLLAVKQTAIETELLAGLAQLVPMGGLIALFQNGIGHYERLREALPGRRLIRAVVTEGALRLNDTTVRHTGIGEIHIGDEETIERKPLFMLEHLLKLAGFSVCLSKQLDKAIARKLLVNSIINPLTAIWRIRNGELMETDERMKTMGAVFHESFDIIDEEYSIGDPSELWDEVLRVCRATALNESSMLQDVRSGKATEIEFINGAICRLAAKQGKASPWNQILTALVKAVQ